jgi:hypothetical protein
LLGIKPISNERGWDKGKKFSEGQRGFLKRNGFDPDKIDFSNGKQIMDAIGKRIDNHLCTVKQATLLRKHGCDTNVTFEVASSMIDQIAKNGWHKPDSFALPAKSIPPIPKPRQLETDDITF